MTIEEQMYRQYAKQQRNRAWLFIKVLLFLIPVALIFYLYHQDSQEIKKAYKRIESQQQEYLQNFDVSVFESGYLKKKTGVQEVYVPSLAVRVTNLTDRQFSNLLFYAFFKHSGQFLCRGSATLFRLNSFETKDLYLRCVDSVVFGSVFSGINLVDAFGTVEYSVTLDFKHQRLTVIEGILDFNVLVPE